jgi:hypothetical protein
MRQAFSSMTTKRPPPNWQKLLGGSVLAKVGGTAGGGGENAAPAAAAPAAAAPVKLEVQEKQLARLVRVCKGLAVLLLHPWDAAAVAAALEIRYRGHRVRPPRQSLSSHLDPLNKNNRRSGPAMAASRS